MTATEREYMLRVRMSEEEREMLTNLAESDGVTASDVVRLFIRREHEQRYGKKKRPTK
jgi:antitoxin component of RelBE/YafQ-DinJ toxin-antitoxin module